MFTETDCLFCQGKGFTVQLRKFDLDEATVLKETKRFLKVLAALPPEITPPEIAVYRQERLQELLGIDDPYRREKEYYNRVLLDLYEEIYQKVVAQNDPVVAAIKVAVSGNIIDISPGHHIDIDQTVQKSLEQPFAIDGIDTLIEKIKRSRQIVVLGDNTGEIVFDKLMLQIFKDNGIDLNKFSYVVRGKPILNDALYEDAVAIELTDLVQVISNGDNTPGTALNRCTLELNELYDHADLIISKGMGNFETLNHLKDPRVYFLLIAKCPLVAGKLGVNLGDFVVANGGR